MTREEFEKAHNITVLKHDDEGDTERSLDNARRWIPLGGMRPERVYLLYVEDPWDYFTYVVDRNGRGFRFSGFAWGYGGTGPAGLETLITEVLGWKVPRMIPAPNGTCARRLEPNEDYTETVVIGR